MPSGQARPTDKSLAPSPIVTLTVGREGRLFAAHEDVLCQAPFFEKVLHGNYLDAQNKRIALPDEEPEVFSAVLEYLYKGDYYPRLLHNKRRNSWELEDSLPRRATPHTSPTIYDSPTIDAGRAGQTAATAAATSSPQTPSAVEATVYLTRPTRTAACAPITWRSSSGAARPSSGAAPCRPKWKSAAATCTAREAGSCSSTCLSPCATTSTTSLRRATRGPQRPSERPECPVAACGDRQGSAQQRSNRNRFLTFCRPKGEDYV